MAAYAGLVSLMNTIEQILNHPRISILFDKKQIESLLEVIGWFLQDFMESHSHGIISKEKAEVLEGQIASSAHAAEDVIESHVADKILAGSNENSFRFSHNESHVVDQIHVGPSLDHREKSCSFLLNLKKLTKAMKRKVMKVQQKIRLEVDKSHEKKVILAESTGKCTSFLPDLQTIIEDMHSIMEEAMKVKEERGFQDQLPTYSVPAASSRPLTTGKTTMVGFDNYLIQLMDTLTGRQSNRQVIPIVGMGGIGKTTLARNAFENSLITEFFDLRAWVTVSQNYSVREILLELLSSLVENTESFLALDQHQLGEQLYKRLWGRRYLIILDDIWGIEAWYNIKLSFPDNKNGSRIVITTRLTDVAVHFGPSCLTIDFLDEDQSWYLFCEKAFGQEGCPNELEDAGKNIAKNCKRLPLSIVVTGAFLRKSNNSQGFWESVAKDTNSFLNSEGEEQCLDILSLSYSHLPAHLKPCFLYMGVFLEDEDIHVSRLIKLWVAEGFLKPNKAQSLEEVAKDYLKDLVDRNLILVRRWGSSGKIKTCNIHDLSRELCLRVAKKEKFFCVLKLLDTPRAINREHRIVIHESMSNQEVFHAVESASLARSLICKGHRRLKFRLLRVLNVVDEDVGDGGFLEADFMCVNLRCLDYRFLRFLQGRITGCRPVPSLYLPRKISLFWNLQTISMKGCNARIIAPPEIWEMPQLRHLKADILCLLDPPPSDRVERQDDLVLQNLQTLSRVQNFKLSDEACKRIPHIKKLCTIYADFPKECEASSYYCPHNFRRFLKLESLHLYFLSNKHSRDMMLNVAFPSSLQKLILLRSGLCWEDLSMIGSLPHLEVLKLEFASVRGREWNPVEGEFRRLKFLQIYACNDLTKWNADHFNFPVLEKLALGLLNILEEIPSGIGEIPTLRFIRLHNCTSSCAFSAVKILEEQESLGNSELVLEVQFHIDNKIDQVRFREMLEEESFTSNNLLLNCGSWL